MKEKVLVTRHLPGRAVETIAGRYKLTVNPHDRNLSYEELRTLAAGCSGILSVLRDRIDRPLIEAVPELRVVSNFAVGYDNIDLAAAAARGIIVTNTPGVLTEATADIAFALIMAVGRRIVEADRFTRAGKFDGWAPEMLLGADVHGSTLGIVGLGGIGLALARRAAGFDMEVLYYSRNRKPGAERQTGAKYAELDDLLKRSDYVSVHAPLSSDTFHLIDQRRLGLMKPTAFLINTARGPVVDEDALVRALQEGRIAGAGLDVFEEEPKLHPGLAGLDNTVLLPHIGSASLATRIRMADMAVENLLAVLAGDPPPNPVSLPGH
ncbi:MAG TPA: D-glycerate dehydrogenase [Candidatus Glassbacteria bacterium]|nr:D-glycerate dehydrogenase [Candidatus Glassbacteria bacterium]